MKIVFFGTPHFVNPILKVLTENFEVVAVVTAPDSIEGRKKILTPSPVKKFSHEKIKSAEVFTLEQFSNTTIQQIVKLKPDLFIVAAYGKILPQNLLDIPKYGSLNIHPSLLPKYRGPSPIQTTLINGDIKTGVSIIKMDEEVDHGPLLAQWEEEISSDDTFESLHDRLFTSTAEKLPTIIKDYVLGITKPVEQVHKRATFCLKITKEDGFIDATKHVNATTLDRKVRAYFPWPTVWLRLDKNYGGQAKKGAILKLLPSKKVQLEGKSIVKLKDFLNGYPTIKEFLEKIGYT